jgi:hypothetical protein
MHFPRKKILNVGHKGFWGRGCPQGSTGKCADGQPIYDVPL